MNVLIVASVGVTVVLASILVLRLHALLGLLLGSLVLLWLTPAHIKLENASQKARLVIQSVDGAEIGLSNSIEPGEFYLWPKDDSIQLEQKLVLETSARSSGNHLWYKPVDVTMVSRWREGDFLVPKTVVDQAIAHPNSRIGTDLTHGFTEAFRKLGIPVTMAALIGVCLIESGAATKLVGFISMLFGKGGTAPALTVSGFLLGVPVFFENVFYLLLPLAKAIGRKQPEFFLTAVMAIIVGATMAHSLVPPTPGPLLVCRELGVSIKSMMIGGFLVGGCASSVGFVYGLFCRRWVTLLPEQVDAPNLNPSDQLEPKSNRQEIPLLLAILPIAIPVIAFSTSSFAEDNPGLIFMGTAILSILMLRRYATKSRIAGSVAKGLSDAGMIVLITSAGGAFGASLQQLQLATAIADNFRQFSTPWGLLVSAWVLTAIIRAAQGSATVAMITTAGIVSPIMTSIELPFHPVYLALAIGCGSKPFPWLNDSGFWQVSTMTGMSVSQTLKTFSAALTIMGTVGFFVTLLGAWLLPFKL